MKENIWCKENWKELGAAYNQHNIEELVQFL